MADYLTQDDVDNYGPELIDVTQRAALQAIGPQLQQLQQRLAVESRRNLDRQIAEAVPDYQQVDRDPAWHRWLLGIDTLSGRVRQTLLNEAIAAGDPHRVKSFFDGFKREHGSSGSPRGSGRATPLGTRVYSRDDIAKLYRKHQQGAYANREAEWARIEQDIFAAQHEGRVVGAPYLTK